MTKPKYGEMVTKIANVLEAAREFDCESIDVDLPYYTTSTNQGKFNVKATFRKRRNDDE